MDLRLVYEHGSVHLPVRGRRCWTAQGDLREGGGVVITVCFKPSSPYANPGEASPLVSIVSLTHSTSKALSVFSLIQTKVLAFQCSVLCNGDLLEGVIELRAVRRERNVRGGHWEDWMRIAYKFVFFPPLWPLTQVCI